MKQPAALSPGVAPRPPHSARVAATLAGERLDKALAVMFPDHSRSALQKWLREGRVTVDGHAPRQSQRVHGGEQVAIEPPVTPATEWGAQALPLVVIHEDDEVLVVAKPAGTVVHPGAGNPAGTLVNALLHHAPELSSLPRAGIVHRLDKDTSGLLVVARTEAARRYLTAELAARRIRREYLALVSGRPIAGSTIDAPIGRHSRDRLRMSVSVRGRPAVTHYRIERRFRAHTLLRVILDTGRTHQIRVHLAHAGFPVAGDPTYGRRMRLPAGVTDDVRDLLRGFRRQALHAVSLTLRHPASGYMLSWTLPMPPDMQGVVDALAADAARGSVAR